MAGVELRTWKNRTTTRFTDYQAGKIYKKMPRCRSIKKMGRRFCMNIKIYSIRGNTFPQGHAEKAEALFSRSQIIKGGKNAWLQMIQTSRTM